jgi:hypothetical protein
MHRGLVQSNLWGSVTGYKVVKYQLGEDQAVVKLSLTSPTKRYTLMTHWTDEGHGPQIVALGPRPPGVPKPKPRPPKRRPPRPKKQGQ